MKIELRREEVGEKIDARHVFMTLELKDADDGRYMIIWILVVLDGGGVDRRMICTLSRRYAPLIYVQNQAIVT